jgi:hypothetical protein
MKLNAIQISQIDILRLVFLRNIAIVTEATTKSVDVWINDAITKTEYAIINFGLFWLKKVRPISAILVAMPCLMPLVAYPQKEKAVNKNITAIKKCLGSHL